MIRKTRKMEHLQIASDMLDGPCSNGFEDIYLIPDSIPEWDLEEIDCGCFFMGKKLQYPVIINALTGGTEQAKHINKIFAGVAKKYGLAMAVGSQTIAIEDPSLRDSFSVVREVNPDGVILANIGAGRPIVDATQAINMIHADGLQLHFNVAQELAMREGDRRFKGILANVASIMSDSPVPVIAKEVGFGFSREAVQKLYAKGIHYVDNGGKGGTNFVAIEGQREGLFGEDLMNWGIPTAMSLAEIVSMDLPVSVIASGGIRTAADVVKSLAMGAILAGITGPLLKVLLQQGEEGLNRYVENFLYQLKAVFLMCGARNYQELQNKPVIIMGNTGQWLRARSIDPEKWAKNHIE